LKDRSSSASHQLISQRLKDQRVKNILENWGGAVDWIIEDNELQRVMLLLQVWNSLEGTHCTWLLQMN